MRHEIVICMGSSCFSRGNQRNLPIITRFIAENHIDCRVSGHNCAMNCRKGPNLSIDGENFEKVDPETLVDLLQSRLGKDAK